MATQGRNDLCACGSGKERMQCCEGQPERAKSGRLLLALVGAMILGGIAAGVLQFRESSSMGPAPGLVWSPEHGHYH